MARVSSLLRGEHVSVYELCILEHLVCLVLGMGIELVGPALFLLKQRPRLQP